MLPSTSIRWLAPLLALLLSSGLTVRAGSLLREVFLDIPGLTVADLTNHPSFPNSPSSSELLTTLFEAPTDVAENYGQRLRGTFTAPLSGDYTFWIASDDYSVLLLSSTASPANSRVIAQVPGWTPSRVWDQFPEQQSEPITLVAGNRYYIEALMKEAGGGDNLAVRWRRPDNVDQGPIPLDAFIAWGSDPEPPRIAFQPQPLTVIEGGQAVFTTDYDNSGITDIFWRRNGAFIPGATGSTLNFGPVQLSDNGTRIQAFLTNSLGTTNSNEVLLTVQVDTVAPALASVAAVSTTELQLEFSEAVRAPAGPVASSFSIIPPLAITAVQEDPIDARRLRLTVAPLDPSISYTLTINGVTDRAQNANRIADNTQSTFSGGSTTPFVIEIEDFNFGSGQTLPIASTMPYTGGAYAGRTATLGVDFNRIPDSSSPFYRNDDRIPMNENSDVSRGDGAWSMTTNFKLGWVGEGQWYNYTRTIPAGRYRVLAAISHGDSSPAALRASLSRVTSPANIAAQTLEDLGSFSGEGTGGWGINRLVPLRDNSGIARILQFGGTETLRMNLQSGDFDYLILMPLTSPRIALQPQPATVVEGRDVSFSVATVDNEAASFQWTSNSVPIPGATLSNLNLTHLPLSANSARIRVAVANGVGTTLSDEVLLNVTADSTPPTLVRAFNNGLNEIVVEFSEPVLVPAGPPSTHFTLNGGVTISSVQASDVPHRMVLTVSTLSFSTAYTLTVSGIQDRSASANILTPGSTAPFNLSQLAPTNLGGNDSTGAVVLQVGANNYDVSSTGGNIGGNADSGAYGWQNVSGNFDLRVRVADLAITHPHARGGIVARADLAPGSPFAGSFASSALAGSVFGSRVSAGANAVLASSRGGFPVNYPHSWLRLRRVGNAFTGFASLDGTNWTQLGAVNLTLPAEIPVGLAVSGVATNAVATARFRDYSTSPSPVVAPWVQTREGLGISSRRTRIVLSEIHYNTAASGPGSASEFLELYNASDIPENLSGWSLAGGVTYRFPDGLSLGGGQFIVVAADPAALTAESGLANILGPYDGSLNNAGELIQVRDELGALKLEVEYGSSDPWPVAADGSGHSLVLVNPSYGEADPRAWTASAFRGGNPGQMDPLVPNPATAVVLNEFLAHTDLPLVDYLELYNRSNISVDLSGHVITDNLATNRFRFPPGSTIPPRGHLALDESQLGFRLDSTGESVFFISPDGLRVLDAVQFGPQENGVAFGRSPDGSPDFRRLSDRTPGAPNAPWRIEDIVINEIMYNPISQNDADEFIELHNRSGAALDLSGWSFTQGIRYTFPQGTSIAAGGYIVVSPDRDRLLANHPSLPPAIAHGNWSGSLRNRGERITLGKPDQVVSTNQLGEVTVRTVHVPICDFTYEKSGRWGKWADGGGSSLELIDPRADPRRPSSWADSDETAKAAWQLVSITDVLRFGSQAPDRLHVGMMGAGECLIDDVQVLNAGGTSVLANGGFESGTGTGAIGWTLAGHHSRSRIESSGAFTGSRVLRIIAPGDLDAGRNVIHAPLSPALANNLTGTLRARVRWQAGWPEVLFRTRGGGLEMTARLNVPTHLGTPGQANSRRVPNAGPAIYDVTHTPAVPDANQPVVVTARFSDPDGVASASLRFRNGETGSFSSTVMRDDGLGGDAIAGDGLWSATLIGRTAGTRVQFRIEAFDNASPTVASSAFPSGSLYQATPAVSEALIRWGDPVPFGTFTHIHSWTTPSVDSALNADGLDNTYRDSTLVHGNLRVIYNAGIRRKGSPYTGQADFTVTVPRDDLLLGVADRVYALTGNGGEEATRMRNQIANWFGRSMGLPYLNTHYIRFHRNGVAHGAVGEDFEQPNNYYAESWFPDGGEGDLRKVALWFEYNATGGFNPTAADLGNYRNPNGQFNLSRYRWNWQGRPTGTTANDFTNFFALVTAANSRASTYNSDLLNIVDIEQWMRSFAYDGCMGNWDTWGTGNGQNKYVYYQPGGRWRILPWDLDWVLGLGDPTNRRLFGGNDANVNHMFDHPAFRRMAWRAYREAINGPFQPASYQPQFDARSAALAYNRITGTGNPSAIASYLNARREFIRGQLNQNDVSPFAITSNGGTDFTSPTAIAVLDGTAPFSVVTLHVNGSPVPVEWTAANRFRIRVPLTQAINLLQITGVDRDGSNIPDLARSITVRFNGILEAAEQFVVINEIHYNPVQPGASFLELHNRSTSTAFDLSGHRLNGIGYTFPPGSVLSPGAFLLLVRDRAAFSLVHGTGVTVFDQFTGSLSNNGERLSLLRPTEDDEFLITDVRYDNRLPWPTNAAGFGSSLQLIDPSRGSWRIANWSATATNSPNATTPGRANAVTQSLTPFPTLWLNEVLPNNPAGPVDNAGERDPFVEIFNSGDSTVSLDGLFLTDSFTNLTRWPFPNGLQVPARGFLTVWLDGQPGQSADGIPHTSFRIDPTTGSIALVRLQGSANTPAVLDELSWNQLPAGRSFGSLPDGEPRTRRALFFPTPGAANNPAVPPVQVVINEFMAQNTSTVRDPADGQFDDWFELYNAGTNTVDLTGYLLTDNLAASPGSMFRIPPGYPIAPGGFLLVWADNQPQQNSPTNAHLHVDFALARSGEQIGLFDPTGALVDGLTFGSQANDVSEGRFPDGAEPPFIAMDSPTPGTANFLPGGNLPPSFNPVADVTAPEQTLISFIAVATDPDSGQRLIYTLGADAPEEASIDPVTGHFQWLTAESDGPGTYTFSLRATDNGTPPRVGIARFTVTVSEVNRPPLIPALTALDAAEGSLLSLQLSASDPDLPPNDLIFTLASPAPGSLAVSTDGILTWIPEENFGNTLQIVLVRVTDNGSPPLSATGEIRIAVAEVNNPPVFAQPEPVSVDELSPLSVQLSAVDPEGTSVRFNLDSPPPTGLQLDATTGLITWTPTEAQGPGSYVLLIRATDSSPEQVSTVRELLITVREVNQPPTLAPIASVTLDEGQTVAFVAQASDNDRPAQNLTFSLDPGAPRGAFIDPGTGEFLWVTDDDLGAGVHPFTVLVTDDGPGSLSATRTFEVTSRARFKVVINEFLRRPATPGTEFIELFNRSASTGWDLQGFRLSGSNLNFTFPQGTVIAPRGHLVVVQNPAAFRQAFGSGATVAGAWTGSLGALSDSIVFLDDAEAGGILDRVDYLGAAPWPASTAPTDTSLQLIDSSQDRNRVANWGASVDFTGNRNLIQFTDTWRYFQSGPPAGGTNWRRPGFNDASWPSGGGLLYVENSALPTNKTTALVLGQLTYYFRKNIALPAMPAGSQLRIRTVLDDGYVLWINGNRAHSLGMGNENPTHDTLASRLVDNATFEGPFTIPTSFLVPGDNTLAVEVHQNAPGSSDIVFGLEIVLIGGITTPSTPGLANNVSPVLPGIPPVRINEVLARNTSGLRDVSNTPEPWIELVNTSPEAVALDGLFLSDSDLDLTRWSFPNGTLIPARGFLTVFADGQPQQSSPAELHTSFRLTSTPDAALRITLSRLNGFSIQVIDYLHTRVGTLPDIASGRFPDGIMPTLEELLPTPGGVNVSLANPTLAFDIPVLTPGGQVQLILRGIAGRRYRIDTADILGAWSMHSEVTAAEGGTPILVDPTAPTRFYRAVELPR